ncbi:MAG: hypothetical protein ACI9WS_002949 [Paraglaciecola psychrophila]|jgi:hypothetical protein
MWSVKTHAEQLMQQSNNEKHRLSSACCQTYVIDLVLSNLYCRTYAVELVLVSYSYSPKRRKVCLIG